LFIGFIAVYLIANRFLGLSIRARHRAFVSILVQSQAAKQTLQASQPPTFRSLTMRRTFTALAFTIAASFAQAQTPAQTQTPVSANTAPCSEIEVTGLQPDTGTLHLAVYNSAESFFKKPVWAERIKVVGNSMRITVCGVAAGEIAVTGFQDLNSNQKMDSNLFGIPNEPYGASGKPPKFSAPTWDTTKLAWPAANNAPVRVRF
jgi:uncharacterized protein (DUF2141 family)